VKDSQNISSEQAGGNVIRLAGEMLGYGNLSAIFNPFFVVHGQSDMNWPALFVEAVLHNAHTRWTDWR
jgi:3'-phosphoadenosine 5'-phosphosulfate (PAPS) 3'-phosphatase